MFRGEATELGNPQSPNAVRNPRRNGEKSKLSRDKGNKSNDRQHQHTPQQKSHEKNSFTASTNSGNHSPNYLDTGQQPQIQLEQHGANSNKGNI